eukprot:252433-Amorphochlora_amoeboformis.AAC.1
MVEFQLLLGSGDFWELNPQVKDINFSRNLENSQYDSHYSLQHKMFVSPEVHHFEWMPLRQAVAIATSPHIQYVNDYQLMEFHKYE